MSENRVIAITGGSCSGKTTLVEHLRTCLGPRRCALVAQDSYYHDQPAALGNNLSVNFDHPDAIDFDDLVHDLARLKAGASVDAPVYDFTTHRRVADKHEHIAARELILVDGILLLTSNALRKLADITVFVDCDSATRLSRRLDRDVRERGRKPDNIRAQFSQQVEPMHRRFVQPSARHADIVLDQERLNSVLEDSGTDWLLAP